VVGILEGTDAALKNEAVVIGAHYDHLGRGGAGSLAANSKEIHYGADDNASGVSAMLELAREFSTERKNKRTLIFIAFGGEEEGLLGSKFYVNNPAFPLNKTVAMINMDMVGRLKEDKLTVGGIGTASEWKNLISEKNKSLATLPKNEIKDGVKTLTFQHDVYFSPFALSLNEDGFGPSDHSSFYAQKIPVLFFFTGTHLDYHKPTDTAEKINYQGLLKITDYVAEIIRAVDGNPAKPTYAVAKSSGAMGGRMGFNVSLGTIPNYADNNNDGLLLDGVRDDSPAARAGLKAGDKVVRLAGRDVRNATDYTFVLGEMKAGVEYEVEIVRGAERLKLKIVPAARK
jgi:Zn-dependent M28 family amino/carboxypeptidase